MECLACIRTGRHPRPAIAHHPVTLPPDTTTVPSPNSKCRSRLVQYADTPHYCEQTRNLTNFGKGGYTPHPFALVRLPGKAIVPLRLAFRQPDTLAPQQRPSQFPQPPRCSWTSPGSKSVAQSRTLPRARVTGAERATRDREPRYCTTLQPLQLEPSTSNRPRNRPMLPAASAPPTLQVHNHKPGLDGASRARLARIGHPGLNHG